MVGELLVPAGKGLPFTVRLVEIFHHINIFCQVMVNMVKEAFKCNILPWVRLKITFESLSGQIPLSQLTRGSSQLRKDSWVRD